MYRGALNIEYKFVGFSPSQSDKGSADNNVESISQTWKLTCKTGDSSQVIIS